MSRKFLPLVAILCASTIQAQTPSAPRFVVGIQADQDILTYALTSDATVLDHIEGTRTYLLEGPQGCDLTQLLDEIQTHLEPLFLEPDERASAPEIYPQDTIGFPDTTGLTWLESPSSETASGTLADEGIYASQSLVGHVEAEQIQSAAYVDVPIAMIGSGVDFNHPLFQPFGLQPGVDFVNGGTGAGWETGNGIDDDGDGQIDEGFGHGTFLAGIVLRINPRAVIHPLRVLDDEGNGSSFAVAKAIHHALAQGYPVILLTPCSLVPTEVVDRALDRASSRGATVFAPVGNTGGELVLFPASRQDPEVPGLPAEASGLIGVAAVDSNDLCAPFSGVGEGVDLSAPGVEICGPLPGGSWGFWSSTSISAAAASGTATLVLSIAPDYGDTPARPMVESADWIPGGTQLGAGRISALDSLLAIVLNQL